MRRAILSVIAAAAIGVSVLAAGPAQAVRFGEPDTADGYTGVGLMVMIDNGVPQWRCTGALVSPTVLLTAGHCTEDPSPGDGNFTATARVYFDVNVVAPPYPTAGGFTGVPYSGPNWQGGLFLPDTGDVGRVIMDAPMDTSVFETYPMAANGTLDALASARGQQNVNFTVVGYGLQQVKPFQIADRTRMVGEVQVINVTSALAAGYNVATTNNPGKGTGGSGTCFGDSGGPVFYNGEIVGVNSFVMNANCAGTSYAYRVDRTPVQEWVTSAPPA